LKHDKFIMTTNAIWTPQQIFQCVFQISRSCLEFNQPNRAGAPLQRMRKSPRRFKILSG
jgi:hypothetical protein